MTSLFISYSRKDIEFARQLSEALKGKGLDYWIDWEGIPPTVDWWKEIEKGIEEADVFLFLLSPDSVQSPVCKREIEHAVKNGKRLIPVVVRDSKADEVPAELRKLNWIFIRDDREFGPGFDTLITAIHTDYAWVQVHRQLQVKALEWERNKKENSFLLRGKELKGAELQLDVNTPKEPYPTELQLEYVSISRQTSDRLRRRFIVIFIIGLMIIAGLAYNPIREWLADPVYGEWEAATNPAAASARLQIAMDFRNPADVFLVDQISGALYASSNSGIDWRQINTPSDNEIIGLAALEKNLFVLTRESVLFSPNKGKSWVNTGEIPLDSGADLLSININPNNEAEVYVGDNNGTVYRSLDGGLTWKSIESGYKGDRIRAITTNGIALLLATEEGLWVQIVNTNQWTEINLIGCSEQTGNVSTLAFKFPYSDPPAADNAFGFLAAIPGVGICNLDSRNLHDTVLLTELREYGEASSMVLAGQAVLDYEGYITTDRTVLRKRIWHPGDFEWWKYNLKALCTRGE